MGGSERHEAVYRSSSVHSDAQNGQPTSTKRARASAACESCRTRKLGCDGRRPCGRCTLEDKPCVFEDRPERTPLTRVRMTELEDRVEMYERFIRDLLPGLSLDDTYRLAKEQGVNSAVDMAKGYLPVTHSHLNQAQPIMPLPHLPHQVSFAPPTDFLPPPNPFQTPITAYPPLPAGPPPPSLTAPPYPSNTPRRNSASAYPPTRPASPSHADTPFNPEDSKDASAYEWHEDVAVPGEENNVGVRGVQDGMGGALGEQGVSYMGLSSGATFLNAIRRLSSQPIFSASPSNPLMDASFDIASFLGGLPKNKQPAIRPAMRIPPLVEVYPLVDSYFKYFHSLTPLVHEPTIRAQVFGAIPLSAKPGANVLMNMIFAMGAFDLATVDGIDDGDRFYQAAWAALQRDMLEQGTLELVQGLGIMANYLQRSNRPNAGYICLGIAIRMALALGLHMPTTSQRSTPLEKEMRTRVWWALVTLEAGCSVTFGRPHALGTAALKTVPLPINCDDEHLTVSTHDTPIDVQYSTRYSALIVQSRLARATCSVHDRILQSSPAPSIEQVKWCDDRIVSVVRDLPPFMLDVQGGPFRLAKSVQVWRSRDFRAILYRPVLLAAAWDASRRKKLMPVIQGAIATCRTLAQENLRDIADFVATENDPSRGSEWYTLYFAFQASLTLLLSVVWEPSHADASSWRASILTTAGWFRQLHSMKRLGTSYAQILENIVASAATPNDPILSGGLNNPSSGSPLDFSNMITSNGTGVFPQANTLDVDRYWSEIWGNELAPANLNSGGWEQIFNSLGQGFNGNLNPS